MDMPNTPFDDFGMLVWVNDYEDLRVAKEFMKGNPLARDSFAVTIKEFRDTTTSDDYMLLPDRAPGFVLRNRTWCKISL